ncbi:MAG: NADH-quinone oxidoreductase subunit M [Deltaproteobacteria bacterium]|nr:NADH-quinone oxidoreductase subunit M [Deltaproteobacteria bacterium]
MVDHVLTWMTFSPLIGAAIIVFLPGRFKESFKYIAVATAAVPLLLAVQVFLNFDTHLVPDIAALKSAAPSLDPRAYGLQFVDHIVWIKAFNIEYFVGIDGVSVPMVLLTALVSFIAVLASFLVKKPVEPLHNSQAGIKVKERGYYALILLLETGMMGVFVALDFFLFYVFWELMLLPMYFLIGIWGGPRKEYAAIKFFLYTLAGSLLMLLAIVYMYIYGTAGHGEFLLADGTTADHTFNMMYFAYNTNFEWVSFITGKMLWVLFFIGFAIKIPMFPFHTWLPDAHVEAPTAVSVILAGVLLKMGTYGILRINYPIFPSETLWAAGAMAAFGTINIVYGAFCAMAQKDFKSLVAYSSISHMGFVLLGMSSFTQEGMNGAVLQMFNHGTITSMMFLLVGVIYDRAHHRDLEGFGGLAKVMPIYTGFVGLAFLAALGLPGLSGFISEALVFLGAFQTHRVATIISMSGVILAAGYVLWMIHRVFLGPLKKEEYAQFADLNWREWATLVPLAIIVIVLGFYPMPVLNLMSASLGALKDLVLAAAM